VTRRFACLLLVATACSDKPASAALDCEAVIAHAFGVMNSERREAFSRLSDVERRALGMTGVPDELTELQAYMLRACTEDAWPASVRECLREVRGALEPEQCLRGLSDAQLANLNARRRAPKRTMDAYTLPACRSYAKALDDLKRCDKLPPQTRDPILFVYDGIRQVLRETPVAEVDEAIQLCEFSERALRASFGQACGW